MRSDRSYAKGSQSPLPETLDDRDGLPNDEPRRGARRALAHDGPAIVEVIVEQDNPDPGRVSTGEWDLANLEK